MAVRRTGIIYLQRDKFHLYLPQYASVLEFRFVPEMVLDGDVSSSEIMGNVIKLFVTNSKIPPSNFVIVLSDSLVFVHDVLPKPRPKEQNTPGQPIQTAKMDTTQEDIDEEIKHFISLVPFDSVVSKTVPIKNGIRVFAANQELYDAVKKAFEKLGFTIEAVIPGLFFGNNLSARPALDPSSANFFLQKLNAVRQYNMLEQKIYVPEVKKTAEEEEEEESLPVADPNAASKKRLPVLIGVFGVLILILFVMVYLNFIAPQPKQSVAVPSPTPAAGGAVVKLTPTLAPTAEQSVGTPVPADTKNLTVQITTGADSSKTAASLHDALVKDGFKSVQVETQNIGTANAVITFSSAVDSTVRGLVLGEVNKITNDVQIQERKDVLVDVTIILGK